MNIAPILNIKVHNIGLTELLRYLHPDCGGFVVTPNIDHLVKLQRDSEFYAAYQQADYRICDSQILFWLSRFLKSPIKEKIAGSDLLPAFCDYYKYDKTVKIFFLGGPNGVPKKAQEKINIKMGRQIVVGSYCPVFGFEADEEKSEAIVNLINQSGANVLVIGVGAPKQEKWLFKHRAQLKNVRTALAVGAALQFEAGVVPRAPIWMSNAGVEWLHRLINEPRRLWKRYFIDSPPIFRLFIMQRLGLYCNPFKSYVDSLKPATENDVGQDISFGQRLS